MDLIYDPIVRDFIPDPFKNKLALLGEGRHRRGYLSRNSKYVYKVPMMMDGLIDNHREAHVSRVSRKEDFYGGVQFARCRLGPRGILIMEYVKPADWGDDFNPLPAWVGRVDCCQVGHTADGRLVAYDYGNF